MQGLPSAESSSLESLGSQFLTDKPVCDEAIYSLLDLLPLHGVQPSQASCPSAWRRWQEARSRWAADAAGSQLQDPLHLEYSSRAVLARGTPGSGAIKAMRLPRSSETVQATEHGCRPSECVLLDGGKVTITVVDGPPQAFEIAKCGTGDEPPTHTPQLPIGAEFEW